MSHRDAVVDGDSIELSGIAAHLLDLLPDDLSYLVQVGMSGDKLSE